MSIFYEWMFVLCPWYQGQHCCAWYVISFAMWSGGTCCNNWLTRRWWLAATNPPQETISKLIVFIVYFGCYLEYEIIRLWKLSSG